MRRNKYFFIKYRIITYSTTLGLFLLIENLTLFSEKESILFPHHVSILILSEYFSANRDFINTDNTGLQRN